MIKYLGSKRTLIPTILEAVGSIASSGTVLDLFSGTSRVGHALKRANYRVLANDHNAYAHTLATCYVEADAEEVLPDMAELVQDLNQLAGVVEASPEPGEGSAGWLSPVGRTDVARGAAQQAPGFDPMSLPPGGRTNAAVLTDHFTQTYCLDSRFFHPKNGPKIHAIRERIASLHLPRELEAVALVSLMEAADRVDSTTGVQMAYLKQWAPRAHNDLALRVPDILPQAASGKGAAFCMDALDAMRELSPEADIVYLDPPYNQHSYLGNYHIWETLIRWDAPEVYGVACKRTDCRERKSVFNSKRLIKDSLAEVIDACRAPAMVVSFSDEGYLTRDELQAMLSPRGRVRIIERDYKRYVGAQIGIYNPSGEKVGKVSHLRNTEMLFVVTGRRSSVRTCPRLVKIAVPV